MTGAAATTANQSAAAQGNPADKRLAALLRNPRTKSRRVLNGLMRDAVARDLPRLLGTEASNPASSLRTALASVYQPAGAVSGRDAGAGAGLLPPSTALFNWDDFNRADRVLAGDTAPSGQVYWATGALANLVIRNKRYTPTPVPRHADIVFVTHPGSLSTIAVEFSWVNGATNRQNAVIGACSEGFGTGSIQFATYAGRADPTDHDWSLFCVKTDPTGIVYPTLFSGQFVGGFSYRHDNLTKYRVVLHRTSPDTVLVQLPDGQVQKLQHELIAQFWGLTAGLQLRRPSTTDGYAAFTAFASAL